MRNTEKAKQKKFKWYQKNVFIPGVNRNRLEFDNVDVSMLSEISAEETAVVSCDGDIPQLKAMLEDLAMYEESGIIFSKLSATTSAVEQAADNCSVFKGIKTELRHHTV